jgi:hypothetical protein
METNKKNQLLAAREKLVRFLKSKAYPVIPVSKISERKERERKNTKEVFINQLKESIKDPCIFIHFPENDNQES